MPLTCDLVGCDQPATEAFAFRGQPGHIHDCSQHSAIVREFYDVSVSAPLIDGACPIPKCSGDVVIGVGEPPRL